MTPMEEMKPVQGYRVKRAELIKYPWHMRDIKVINEHIAALRAQMDGHGVAFDGCGKNACTGDNVSKLATKISDLERKKAILKAKIQNIERAVEGIPDEAAKRLIKERYFKERQWKDICREYDIKRSTAQAKAEKWIE